MNNNFISSEQKKKKHENVVFQGNENVKFLQTTDEIKEEYQKEKLNQHKNQYECFL